MDEKKQILVVMPGAMELGGVERSLIGLLDSFDFENYQVDLFLYGHHGPLYDSIPQNVNILPEVKELAYLRDSFRQKVMHGCVVSALFRIKDAFFRLLGKPVNNDATWAKILHFCAPKLEKRYDMALSFFLPFDYLSEKVNADVKLGWIHTDYSSEKADWEMLVSQYSKVDSIIAVSDRCEETFSACMPQLKTRVKVIENILPENLIHRDARAFDGKNAFAKQGIHLLSIGRYCTAKNFDNVPDICSRLLEKGLDVYWYIIGFGPDEALIRKKIAEAHMEDRVILLGKKENPYPYLAACDLYVQPSRYEGKCVSVREAQMLGKPVVITRYATSSSQLEDGVDGVIVPMDNEGCAEGIAALLRDPGRMEKLAKQCFQREYTNRGEVNKLYEILNGTEERYDLR